MEAREQLQTLLRIQELAVAIREAEKVTDEAPGRLEQVESHFRERNAEYVAVRDRYDALDADQRQRNAELGVLEESRKKYMDDLMQVKNQREYAAMLKEIDSVKAQISEHEEAILKDMEEMEKLTGELASHEEHIKVEREKVSRERAQIESEVGEARNTIESLTAERRGQESSLPRALRAMIRRLEERRAGVFLSKVDNATCQSCFVRVRPQVFHEIKSASAVHSCGNCRRFLYHEPSLRPETGTASEDGVEALNGGAV